MTDTVAIDFGTSRTKLAYLKDGKPELMRFGHDRPYVPSLFYLPAGDGPVRWGNDAEAMLARDPAGVVVTLKRQLGERSVRGAGGRKEAPGRLLALMLADLRRWAGERLPAFSGQPPSRVCLTLPSLYRPVEERALRDAAAEAGFAADAVELLPEPVAAARAWLAETGNAADEVVVFDAGGGTIDWAYLRRENGAFRVVPECPADGDRQVGGHDVDELLLELLEDAAGAAGEEIASHRSHFLQEVRQLKEQFCRDLPLHPVWVGGREITLPAKAIAAAIEERFISQACDALGRYLDKVRTAAGSKGLPPVLLVGGSSALKGLAPALEQRLVCKTAQWERSEYATVLGAGPVQPPPPPIPVPPVREDSDDLISQIDQLLGAEELPTRSPAIASPQDQIIAQLDRLLAQGRGKQVSLTAGDQPPPAPPVSTPVPPPTLIQDVLFSYDPTAKRVKEILVEHLGVEASKVNMSANFIDDLGADSLDTVELVMAFEEEFGIEIPDETAEKLLKVGDVVDYIKGMPTS